MLSFFGFLSETRNIFSLLNCLRPYRGCWLRSTTLATALSASSPSSLETRFQQLTDEHIISDLVSSSQLSCSAQTQPYHIFLISCPLSCFFLAVTPLSCTLVTLLVCRSGWRGACLLVHTQFAFSKYMIFGLEHIHKLWKLSPSQAQHLPSLQADSWTRGGGGKSWA